MRDEVFIERWVRLADQNHCFCTVCERYRKHLTEFRPLSKVRSPEVVHEAVARGEVVLNADRASARAHQL
jgi:hypothetical protein